MTWRRPSIKHTHTHSQEHPTRRARVNERHVQFQRNEQRMLNLGALCAFIKFKQSKS